MSFMRRYWPILFLALLPLIPLWKCVFQGDAIGPFDQIRQMTPPLNAPKPSTPWDVLQADGVLQFYPWRDMVFKAWGNGKLPLWNPFELAGTPLLANSQSAGFYPPHVLLGLLHFPTVPAMVLLAWFHLFWAGLGTYFLARRLGATSHGALIAGASFELSAFMLAWTGLPSVISTVAWIPWLLAGIKIIASAPADRLSGMLLAAFAFGMMFLAGHLQFAAYGCMAAVFLSLWLVAAEWKQFRPGMLIFKMGVSLVFGFALAAPQLLPVLNYAQFSHRKAPATEAGFADYKTGALKPFELANLTHAYTLGSPRTPVEAGDQTISAYWPAIEKPGANLAESAITIGPFLVGLIALLAWKEKRNWPLIALGCLALLLALGTVLNWPLYFLVPGWSATGSPGRIIVLFVLAACVLGGIAAGGDFSGLSKGQKWTALVLPLLSSILCFLLAPLGASDKVSALASDATSTALQPLFLGAIIATAGIAALVFPAAAKYRVGVVAIPVLLAWLGYASNIIPTSQPMPIRPATSMERVAYINSDWQLLISAHALAPPNTAYLLGEHELAGYDSLIHKDTKKLLDDIDGKNSAPAANGNMLFIKPGANRGLLAEAGVTKVYRFMTRAELGRSLAGNPVIEEINGPGRASTPSGPAQILSETSTQLTVSATGPGRLVVRDRNMPGWIAKLDGQHVPVEGTMWREVDLPSGIHTVEFNYVPPGLMAGLYLGVPAWLLLAIGATGSAFTRRKRTATE